MRATDIFNMLRNPQAFAMQQMQQLMQANPQVMQQCQSMLKGKNHEEQVAALRELYTSKGMDLDTAARQYGVQL